MKSCIIPLYITLLSIMRIRIAFKGSKKFSTENSANETACQICSNKIL